jgi:ABC-type glycerol-3-phosphate transport system substrate-binding protein
MKKLVSYVLALLLVFTCTNIIANDFGEKDPASYNATLTFLVQSTGQPNYMINEFNKVYPNIKIELIEVPAAELQEKIITTAMSGVDVPDMFACRTQFVKALVNAGDRIYLDFKSLGDVSEWTKDIERYVVDVGTDSNGALRSIAWQCPVGGVYYRRSLAKEYFDTDDPTEIAKLFANTDEILKTAETLKQKSGGKVKLFADAVQDIQYLLLTNAGGFLKDNVLNTGDGIKEIYELSRTFYDNEYCHKIRNDSNAINAAILADEVFAYCLPTWGLNYNIMPNFPEMEGDWAVCEGPYPFVGGGSWFGISSQSDNVEEAYVFIKYVLSDPDFQISYASNFGDYTSNKVTHAIISAMDEEEAAVFAPFRYLGGQNAYAYWTSQLEKGVNSAAFSPYDEYFTSYLMSSVVSYATGLLSLEEAIETFKFDCKSYAPDISVQ